MTLSRRTFVSAVLPGAVLGLALPAGRAGAASPVGDVVGKITVGYQGWFACPGDGAPINGWWHWSNNWGQPPSPSNNAIVAWPDMREFTGAYQSAFANLGNGQPAKLFSSYDQQTVDTHFLWMKQNAIDTAALQRFNPFGGEGPTRDAMAGKVRAAAEKHDRKFYVMYDVTNWTNMQSEIKADWTAKMSAHTASAAYAKQNGKPVVGIWGFGFADEGRPWGPAPCLEVVNWFKAQGCYVMGGVPTYWRTGVNDSRPGFSEVYHAFHMISPWMVGRIGNVADTDRFYAQVNVPDQADCNAHGIDYQPCVLPGGVGDRQRAHGDFMWRQFYNMVRVGAQGIYISMFDEFNEGNQIAKTAESAAQIPVGSGYLGLDEDGTACSSDYYLRLTGDGGRMLKGQLALTATRPTQPMVGGPVPTGDLAKGRPTSASSSGGSYPPGNAVDGSAATYWESANNAFPQWIEVDLGAAHQLSRIVLKLPPNWEDREQSLAVQGSADRSSYVTLAGSRTVSFATAAANTATIPVPPTPTRYVRITFSSNSRWPAAQAASFEVYGLVMDDTPPSAPGALTSTAKTATSVSLSWTASADPGGSVTGYQVRQSGTVVATTSSTAATVTGLSPATAYSFTVTAQDNAGLTSPPSNTVSVTTDAAPAGDLARGKQTTASSTTQNYGSGNAVDGDAASYWESANNAFPQWIQVDLGGATSVGRVVLRLPANWESRAQTLAVQGSTDGTTFTTLSASAARSFGQASAATITFSAAQVRHLRLTFTANTAWPAAQLSALEAYAS